jgi:hypothetical protein
MSDPTPKPQTINIAAAMPEFLENQDNTSYANIVNVAFDGSDCCLTFLRKPRPMSLNLESVQSGQVRLEMTPVSRVYLPVDVARGLCQALAQNIAALDKAREAQANRRNGV